MREWARWADLVSSRGDGLMEEEEVDQQAENCNPSSI